MKSPNNNKMYSGMVIFNNRQKEFSICDVELTDTELVIAVYKPIAC
ncbi:hypothetical protein [Croceivirga radicis]|nr:hypothetical protein [Croceivirga radicis]